MQIVLVSKGMKFEALHAYNQVTSTVGIFEIVASLKFHFQCAKRLASLGNEPEIVS